LISKPEPQYTEDARKNQITGTVVLKVVFASSGQVTNIRTVSGLPFGLTERAIAAARMIKFVPATKDGHQVSMWMQLEYNFQSVLTFDSLQSKKRTALGFLSAFVL
jgi:protein TonB